MGIPGSWSTSCPLCPNNLDTPFISRPSVSSAMLARTAVRDMSQQKVLGSITNEKQTKTGLG